MNYPTGTPNLEKFLSERFHKIAEAREEINRKKQQLKLEHAPIGEDGKENTDIVNQVPFQVLNLKKNAKQISPPLQSNKQRTPMPILPPVDVNLLKENDPNTLAVLETPKSVRRRKPPKNVVFINSREVEKQRFASAMASSKGTAVLGCNSTQISPQIKDMRRFTSNMPNVSPRQLEIDRLASLFECSEESCLRNSRIVVDEHPKTPVACLRNSRIVVDEHPKTPVASNVVTELPTSCHVVCPALESNFVDGDLSRRGGDMIKIDIADTDLTNYNDATTEIPIGNAPDIPHHSTTHKGNDCIGCIENENCSRKSTLTVPGNILMGVGEHEARRSQLLKERRREYCDYMKQVCKMKL